MDSHILHPAGSTGNSRAYVRGLHAAEKFAIDFEVTAVGATPTITWNVQGLIPGGDPTVAAHWQTLALVTPDATVAASNAGIVATTVSRVWRFVAGVNFENRFFDGIAVNTTANTNVTYKSTLHRQD